MTKNFNHLCYVFVFEIHRNLKTMISWWEVCTPIWIRYKINWHFVKLVKSASQFFYVLTIFSVNDFPVAATTFDEPYDAWIKPRLFSRFRKVAYRVAKYWWSVNVAGFIIDVPQPWQSIFFNKITNYITRNKKQNAINNFILPSRLKESFTHFYLQLNPGF